MSITVDTLLKLPLLSTSSTLLSTSGLDNVVKSVTILETNNFSPNNIGSNILILTTLSAYHDSLERINKIILELCKIPVAAIGIKIGRFIQEIDPSSIDIANQHGVALFQIQPSVYFRDILSETISVITGNQYLLANRVNLVNQELMQAILNNCSVQDLLNVFVKEIPCFCCCYDFSLSQIAAATSLSCEVSPTKIETYVQQYFSDYTLGNAASEQYRIESTIMFPCVIQEQLLAVFCVISAETDHEVLLPLARSVVSGICIKLLELNSKKQAKKELISSILNDILFSTGYNSAFIQERLKLLNFQPHKNLLIILLTRIDINYKENNTLYTITLIQRMFSDTFDSSIVFLHGREYIILASYRSDALTYNLSSTLSKCAERISHFEPSPFYVGCSISTDDLSLLSRCYQQARKAILFGNMLHPEQRIYLYDKYLELGLISHTADTLDSQLIQVRIIRPLLEYDAHYKANLWMTMETCFLNDSLDTAANVLHIHISTLRYRLHKLETITGYSYFDNRERFTLYLAYLLHQISHNTVKLL